ncbi:hypothetical protein BCR43DRAFT_436901, partial [Syncephalastrum racemosum]
STADICLVALDYAGLSADSDKIEEFLRKFPNVKKLVVDLLPSTGRVHILDSKDILSSPQQLDAFNCRTACVKRSK